ncbi:MAG: DUF1553 domain-containing protein [Planctomycetales bacterium]|nr:DUF1553 domain-containing protein [Planctomycetales bacterium]
MFARNLGFLSICLLGFAALTNRLMPRDLRQPARAETSLEQRDDFLVAVRQLDAEFAAEAQRQDVMLAPIEDEWTIYRRLALGLVGSIPSLEEIRLLEQVAPAERLDWYLDRLLADRRCHDYLAERLARAYVGTEDGPFLVYRRRRFVTWLSDQLAENRRYDSLVRELLSSTGIWTDSPAVNFVTVTNNVNGDSQPDEERLAARTARAFLGVRLDCVQCHDDNLGGDWRQENFQQLAAFFADAHSSLLGITDQQQDYKFTYLHHSEEEIVPAETPFSTELHDPQGSRRRQLANWVTHPENSAFHRAIVNRIWALMLGRPLIDPVDDIPLTGTYPPGLELLAHDFASNGCNLRRLIRLVAHGRPFQTASRSPAGVSEKQEACWAAFPLTRLRPEQVAGSVLQASSLTTIDADMHILLRMARYDQHKDFVKRFGDTGEDDFSDRGGTIPQRLLLMNGHVVRDRTKEDLVGNAITRIAVLSASDEQAIETAYLTALTRRPSTTEANYFLERVRAENGSQRKQALQDLSWALMNSAEFTWNH